MDKTIKRNDESEMRALAIEEEEKKIRSRVNTKAYNAHPGS